MKISACIIAKNEEKNLPRLLESIKGKFDEIVLVDTGSTDRTIEIAKEYGCKIYEKEWNGFADARNYAVEKATGDWIWFFDADMELEEKEYLKFKRLINFLYKNDIIKGIRIIYKNISPDGKLLGLSSTVHLHKKDPSLKWVGKIHERLVGKDLFVPNIAIYVNHYGYSDYEIMKKKIKRNLSLLEEELKEIDKEKETGEYLIKLFYMAQTFSASLDDTKEKHQKVVDYAEEFIKINKEKNIFDKNSIFYKHIYVYLISSLFDLNKEKKIKKYIKEALEIDPLYPDFLFLKGKFLFLKKRFKDSFEYFIKYLEILDKIEDNSIISDYSKYAWKYVDEDLKTFPELSLDYKERIVKKAWKKTKGIYIGNLLANIYIEKDNKDKALNILKKIFFLKKDGETGLRYSLILKEKNINESIKILKGIAQEYPKAYMLLSYFLYEIKEYQEALSNLKFYLHKVKDPTVLPLLKELLILNGYEKEAQYVKKRIDDLTKKQKTNTDNQKQQNKIYRRY